MLRVAAEFVAQERVALSASEAELPGQRDDGRGWLALRLRVPCERLEPGPVRPDRRVAEAVPPGMGLGPACERQRAVPLGGGDVLIPRVVVEPRHPEPAEAGSPDPTGDLLGVDCLDGQTGLVELLVVQVGYGIDPESRPVRGVDGGPDPRVLEPPRQ